MSFHLDGAGKVNVQHSITKTRSLHTLAILARDSIYRAVDVILGTWKLRKKLYSLSFAATIWKSFERSNSSDNVFVTSLGAIAAQLHVPESVSVRSYFH
jgi:hypothetical protein